MLQLPTADTATRRRMSVTKAPADPIFDLIKAHRAAVKASNKAQDTLEEATFKAAKKHGKRPWSLIAWRNYSAIGGTEIERARDEFLELRGIDPAAIEKEYRAAKARERAGERAERAWDRRAGVDGHRKAAQRAGADMRKAGMQMAKTKPQTPSGVAALIKYVLDDELCMEVDWHKAAMETAIVALGVMAGRAARQ